MLLTTSALALGALALSWIVPLHLPPWPSFHSESLTFFSAIVLGWRGIAQVLRDSDGRKIAVPWVTLPLLGLALLVTLQKWAGLLPFKGDAWVMWFYVALCTICLILGFSVSKLIGAAETPSFSNPVYVLACVVVFCGLLSAAIAFAQTFSVAENCSWIARTGEFRRPGANFLQPNHLATFLVMAMASALYLRSSKAVGTGETGLVLLILSAGVAATESRTGALSTLILIAWCAFKTKTVRGLPTLWTGFSWALVLLAMFGNWPRFLKALGILDQHATMRSFEGGMRIEVWWQLIDAISLRPWFGWGFHQIAAAHNLVAHNYSISENYTYSHNLVLDLLVWMGIPLGLLISCLAFTWLLKRLPRVDRPQTWYGVAFLLPLMVHSMVEYPFAYAYFLAPALFMLGALEKGMGARTALHLNARVAAVLMAMATILLTWAATDYLRIEEDYRVARMEALRIGSQSTNYTRSESMIFDQVKILSDIARTRPSASMSPVEIEKFKTAALYYPWLTTQYSYALALALNGNPIEASRQIQVIRRMWGDSVYRGIRRQLEELTTTEHPELRYVEMP